MDTTLSLPPIGSLWNSKHVGFIYRVTRIENRDTVFYDILIKSTLDMHSRGFSLPLHYFVHRITPFIVDEV